MQRKKIIVLAAMAVAVAGLVFWGLKQPANAPTATNGNTAAVSGADIIFFFGRECPHCRDVEKFLADNKVSEKIKFESAEIWHNTANADLMKQKTAECQIGPSGMGVPLLWARGRCYVGALEVENFFRQETGMQSK